MAYDLSLEELLWNRVIRFDPVKNAKLQKERGISLERVSAFIVKGEVLSIVRHPSVKYAHQFLCEVDVEGYVYVVPVVVTPEEVFVKTAYPSRKATKKYRNRSVV